MGTDNSEKGATAISQLPYSEKQLYYIPPQVPQLVYSPTDLAIPESYLHEQASNENDLENEGRNGLDCLSFGVGLAAATALGPACYFFICCWDSATCRTFPSRRNKTFFFVGVTVMVILQVLVTLFFFWSISVLESRAALVEDSANPKMA